MITPEQEIFYAGGRSLSRFGTPSMRRTIPQRGGEDVIETFSRASTGSYIDRAGQVKLAESGAQRINMVDLDGDGIRETPAFVLEAARENVILRSQELDHALWVDVGTPVITANDSTAPDGTVTADRIEDDWGSGVEGVYQDVTVPDDSSTWCQSVFIERTVSSPVIYIELALGTSAKVVFDPVGGGILGSVTAGSINYGVVDEVFGFWRIYLTVTNPTGQTNLRTWFYAAARASGDVSVVAVETTRTGSNHPWGWQLENAAAPSSYKVTVASSASRAVENLSYPLHLGRRAVTIYSRHRERGNVLLTGDQTIWAVGDDSDTKRLQLLSSGINGYKLYQQAAGTALSAVPVFNDEVEVVTQLAGDGSGLIIQSLNRGATTQQADTFSALPTAWNAEKIYLNSLGATAEGYQELLDCAVFLGTHSIADCRKATDQ